MSIDYGTTNGNVRTFDGQVLANVWRHVANQTTRCQSLFTDFGIECIQTPALIKLVRPGVLFGIVAVLANGRT